MHLTIVRFDLDYRKQSSKNHLKFKKSEIKIYFLQAANAQQVLKDIKASNQMAQFLGNKVEMAITKAIEENKTLLKVGLHFEFGDCRYRTRV